MDMLRREFITFLAVRQLGWWPRLRSQTVEYDVSAFMSYAIMIREGAERLLAFATRLCKRVGRVKWSWMRDGSARS